MSQQRPRVHITPTRRESRLDLPHDVDALHASNKQTTSSQLPTIRIPNNNSFQQQTLSIWQPHWTLRSVLVSLVLVALVGLTLGVMFLLTSRNSVVGEVRYDHVCTTLNSTCSVSIRITEELKRPVYVYYKLEDFFQNHRRYVKSVDFGQIRGKSDTSDCDPLERYGDAFDGASNVVLRDKVVYPCGLIASSLFRDRIEACVKSAGDSGGTCHQLEGRNWDNYSVAWSSDRDRRFKSQPLRSGWTDHTPAQGGFVLPPVNDEDFMVWMRTSSFSTFAKLYRVIHNRDLHVGDELVVTIHNHFDVAAFGGKKHLLLATTSYMGTKNDFLGLAYIVTSCMFISVTAAFLVREMIWAHS